MKEAQAIPEELQKFIPVQKNGRYSNTMTKTEAGGGEAAEQLYKKIKHRLFDVNNWARYAMLTNTDFILLDREGKKVNRPAAQGDFMKVRFSRLQHILSAACDFVEITDVLYTRYCANEAVIIQVRPSRNPEKASRKTEHFFKSEASNTFLLYRTAEHIHLGIHGRNEVPNVKIPQLGKKIRNLIFAVLGIVAASKVQWKSLALGILNFNDETQ